MACCHGNPSRKTVFVMKALFSLPKLRFVSVKIRIIIIPKYVHRMERLGN